jgi:serine/threonine-protein kinase
MPFDPPLSIPEVQAVFRGKYAITSIIAAGGQGAVFRATPTGGDQEASGGDVALKLYFEEVVEERTVREVTALRALQSDAIVRLHDEGHVTIRSTRCIFIATSFIQGQTLADRIAQGPVSESQIARIGVDVSTAIDLLWRARIVHRDIKPPNIMVRPNGTSVVIDLGLARHLDLSPITSVGTAWGTMGYLSPEQARGGPLTCKSDIFALGIVLQEAILGRHPTGRRQANLMLGGPSTTGLRSRLPPQLITLIDAMVHRNPVYRPMPNAVIMAFQPLL